MKLQLPVLLLAGLALTNPALAQQPPVGTPLAPGLLVVRNVNVVDVAGGRVQTNCMVVVRDGCIESIGNRAPAGRAVHRLNGRGKYLIPGLWDAHVLALTSAAEEQAALPLYLAHGVTTIRDVSTARPRAELLATAQAVDAGPRPGPHILLAGALIDGPAGTRALGRQLAETRLRAGWRTLATGAFLSAEAYQGVAEVAREWQVPLVGRVPESVTTAEAVAAGHRGFEPADKLLLGCSGREGELVAARTHFLAGATQPALVLQTQLRTQQGALAASFSTPRAAALGQALAQAGAFVVPMLLSDFYPGQALAANDPRFSAVPDEVRQRWAQTSFRARNLTSSPTASLRPLDSLQRRMVAELQRQGVTILAGSNAGWDNPYRFHGRGLLDELEQLVAAGLSPAEALQAATTAPAAALGHRYDLGRIEPDFHADLVLLDANPLDDIRNLRLVRAVVLGGRVLDQKALAALVADAEQSARASTPPPAAAVR